MTRGGYLLCTSPLPPQLHRSSDESFQNCLNSHTITFSCSSSSFDSPHHSCFFFFYFLPWAHEIRRSFCWGFTATVQRPGRPPAPSAALTHSSSHCFAKCGGGGITHPGPTLCWTVFRCVTMLVWKHVKGCVIVLGDPCVFWNITTCFYFQEKQTWLFFGGWGWTDSENLVWWKIIELFLLCVFVCDTVFCGCAFLFGCANLSNSCTNVWYDVHGMFVDCWFRALGNLGCSHCIRLLEGLPIAKWSKKTTKQPANVSSVILK